jgi:hypothetical protein
MELPFKQENVWEPGLEADGDVASTGVNDALGQNGAKLRHHVLVLVVDHLNIWAGLFFINYFFVDTRQRIGISEQRRSIIIMATVRYLLNCEVMIHRRH